jgi:methylglutaconyl-CoA hydratase
MFLFCNVKCPPLLEQSNVMQKNIQGGYVRHEIHQHISTIEFFHPQSNALPTAILTELAHAIHDAANNVDARVIVLKSAGEKAFCSGAFFDELLQVQTEQQGTQFFSGVANVINAIRKSPKFIVGRIQGKCVGGGVGIAAACDYAIALEGADIKLSELSIGIGPFVVGPVLERKMGLSAFSQLAIDSSLWRNTEWARRKGLFAEMHSSVEGMDESIRRLAYSLSHSSIKASSELRKVLWAGTENWDSLLKERAAISGKLVVSAETKQAIESFKAKRKEEV